MSREHDSPFIVDANVLIDYCESDLRMLSLLSDKLGTVHIARSTFDKVKQLTVAAAKKHHFTIVTPDLETAVAASKERGPLAYDDRETLMLAKLHGWVCITNDKPLRRECEMEKVLCLWGLEPMKSLVEHSLIKPAEAIATAKRIQSANPAFITEDIILRFEEQIKDIQRKNEKKQ